MNRFFTVSFIGSALLALSLLACGSGNSDTADPTNQDPQTGIGSNSLPPNYLRVDHFKQCLGETKPATPGGAVFLCLPEEKPGPCPQASWVELKKEFKDHHCKDD